MKQSDDFVDAIYLDGDDGESENDYNVTYVTFNIADPNNTQDVCQLLT